MPTNTTNINQCNPKVYGFWISGKDGQGGGWLMDSSGSFITSLSRGELIAYRRQSSFLPYADNAVIAAFNDDGFPEVS